MDSDRKLKVCLMKVPLFLLKNACGASYKPFYIFFVVPLWGHFRMGILTKIKKWTVKCLYFCELQQELYVHNTFLTFSIFQPTLVYKNLEKVSVSVSILRPMAVSVSILKLEKKSLNLGLEVETLKKKYRSQSRCWDYKKKVSVSVSKLRLNESESC